MSGVTDKNSIALIDPAWTAQGSDYVTALAWAPDGKRLAAACADGTLRLLHPATGETTQELSGHSLGTLVLDWSGDGRWLASGGQDGKARLWEATTGREAAALDGGGAWVEHLAWSSRGQRLATAAGRALRVWNEQGERLCGFDAHVSTISGLAWLRNGRQLATSCYGGVHLWKLGQSRPEKRFEWKGSFLSLALSPNDRHAAAGCQDASMIVWNVKTGKNLGMSGYPGKVVRLDWDTGSRFLASVAGTDTVLWDFSGAGPADRKPLTLSRHVGRVADLKFHPKKCILATAGDEGMLVIWRLPQGRIGHLAFLEQPVSVLAWHPDGEALAVGSAEGEVALIRFQDPAFGQ
jgi:WD40 repeat protein